MAGHAVQKLKSIRNEQTNRIYELYCGKDKTAKCTVSVDAAVIYTPVYLSVFLKKPQVYAITEKPQTRQNICGYTYMYWYIKQTKHFRHDLLDAIKHYMIHLGMFATGGRNFLT